MNNELDSLQYHNINETIDDNINRNEDNYNIKEIHSKTLHLVNIDAKVFHQTNDLINFINESIDSYINNKQNHKLTNKSTNKSIKNSNYYYNFNFDSLDSYEPLEVTLNYLRSDDITNISIGLNKLLQLDYNELFEHPQWNELLQLLDKILKSNHSLDITSNTISIYSKLLLHFQTYSYQFFDISISILNHLLMLWYDESNSFTILNLFENFNEFIFELSNIITQLTNNTIDSLLIHLLITITNCITNNSQHLKSNDKSMDQLVILLFMILSYSRITINYTINDQTINYLPLLDILIYIDSSYTKFIDKLIVIHLPILILNYSIETSFIYRVYDRLNYYLIKLTNTLDVKIFNELCIQYLYILHYYLSILTSFNSYNHVISLCSYSSTDLTIQSLMYNHVSPTNSITTYDVINTNRKIRTLLSNNSFNISTYLTTNQIDSERFQYITTFLSNHLNILSNFIIPTLVDSIEFYHDNYLLDCLNVIINLLSFLSTKSLLDNTIDSIVVLYNYIIKYYNDIMFLLTIQSTDDQINQLTYDAVLTIDCYIKTFNIQYLFSLDLLFIAIEFLNQSIEQSNDNDINLINLIDLLDRINQIFLTNQLIDYVLNRDTIISNYLSDDNLEDYIVNHNDIDSYINYSFISRIINLLVRSWSAVLTLTTNRLDRYINSLITLLTTISKFYNKYVDIYIDKYIVIQAVNYKSNYPTDINISIEKLIVMNINIFISINSNQLDRIIQSIDVSNLLEYLIELTIISLTNQLVNPLNIIEFNLIYLTNNINKIIKRLLDNQLDSTILTNILKSNRFFDLLGKCINQCDRYIHIYTFDKSINQLQSLLQLLTYSNEFNSEIIYSIIYNHWKPLHDLNLTTVYDFISYCLDNRLGISMQSDSLFSLLISVVYYSLTYQRMMITNDININDNNNDSYKIISWETFISNITINR